ncbi:MAG: dihydroorotate dehydrogenase electron transfer subunit [Candidatus Hydrothermarchaeota archaeon]|nr:dihydroorotate dehydrogenase electron transfer subunit [Candidatus Hydrothermarchaeota archaeon]
MNITRITDIINETERIKTFILDLEVKAIPGQFGMFWVPEVDEKPMSLSYTHGNMGVTVLGLGPFSQKMHELKVGDRIGVRGPLGRGYKVMGDKLLIVGGGVGTAPLAPLAENALDVGKEVTAIIGAMTAGDLLFEKRMKKAGAEVLVATDDGTAGHKGFTTDIMREILKKETFDQCFTCGPEIMMVKVMDQTRERKIPTQVSLHRYFKCGVGICGQCAIDDTGFRVCKEGPCFRDKEIEKTREFGRYWRDATSKRLSFGVRK